jgi:PAS domain S-box-containing protein
MFHSATIIAVILGYMGILFTVAMWVERRSSGGRGPWDNGLVYSLSLAIYCTSWTYYGGVGIAVTSGLAFTAFYLGPTLSAVLWSSLLRRMVLIKQAYRINSIADFIAARYNNSQPLAALVTIIALAGIAPYIALQLRAVTGTFAAIAGRLKGGHSFFSTYNEPLIIILMITFTIVFGVRRLDPTERHQGIVAAVAVESVVKLFCFLCAGVFITYFMFDGFTDIFAKMNASRDYSLIVVGMNGDLTLSTWITYLVLSMAAPLMLPRQFHVAVVENSDPDHIRTARWLFPLYLLIISLFILPIAIAGLLSGLPAHSGDSYVLELLMQSGHPLLVLLVFIGGFSAATSMIMISSMTTATMVSNHIVLPLMDLVRGLGWLRRYILQIRWVAVAVGIVLGYWFDQRLGSSHTLANMGMISFAAALQFAPCVIGGLFWAKGNSAGAMAGLSAGFFMWCYTLLLPSFARSGWLAMSILEQGPLGIGLLKPEYLFGLSGMSALSRAVFWSMTANIGCYTFVSLFWPTSARERWRSRDFIQVEDTGTLPRSASARTAPIEKKGKYKAILSLLTPYLAEDAAAALVDRCARLAGIAEKREISVTELAEWCIQVEKQLAGSIGITSAHKTFVNAKLFTREEEKSLSAIYAEIIADLNVTPEELKRKIDYYQEREDLIVANAAALEEKVQELQEQVAVRIRAEKALRISERRYSQLINGSPDAIVSIDAEGRFVFLNRRAEKAAGKRAEEMMGRHFAESPGMSPEMAAYAEEEFARVMGGEKRPPFEMVLTPPGVSRVVLETIARRVQQEGQPAHVQVTLRDITLRKAAEEMMIQTEKMMSVGGLAAGMAHEINNPLAGILQNMQVIRRRLEATLPANEKAAEQCGVRMEAIQAYMAERRIFTMMEAVMASGQRAAKIVRNMLSFSRRSTSVVTDNDIVALMERTLELAGNDYDLKNHYDFRKIRILREYAEDLPTIPCEANQIQQVFFNILKNGAEAMAEQQNGPGPNPRLAIRIFLEGEYMRIDIGDNGPGMAEETRKRILEPFFTTKEVGKGTGLGLSVSFFIITENHGGSLSVESSAGQGTTFIIRLPTGKAHSAQHKGHFEPKIHTNGI